MMKVIDTGPPDAKILLVGEAPGKNEAASGKPFVGAAGNMLRQLLSHSGIDYNKCRVTNVVDERPPGNNFTFFYEDKRRNTPSSRLEKKWQELREKVEQLRPNVVVPLGGEALRAITGRRKITEWRGTPMSYKDIKVMPTFHPSYIMKTYKHHPIAELDFAKALKESISSLPVQVEYVNVVTRPTMARFMHCMEALSGCSRVSFDIETIGKHVRCLSMAGMMDGVPNAISIPFFSFSSSSLTRVSSGDKIITFDSQPSTYGSYWSMQDERMILDAIAELFARDDIEVVGQNSISFDAPLIENEFGIYIKNHYMDTMHSWHVLYPELPKSLSFLCSVLTNYPNYWTEVDHSNDDSEWKYNAMDSIVTLVVSYIIEDELKGVTV